MACAPTAPAECPQDGRSSPPAPSVTFNGELTPSAPEKGAVRRQALPENVVVVPAEAFNDASNNPLSNAPTTTVSADEYDSLVAQMQALPKFPSNPYSGCHARAHFIYTRLQPTVPGKLFKVWIFAGKTLGPALQGKISYTSGNQKTTAWGYHVATAFRSAPDKTMVLDPLASASPLSLEDWVDSFQIDGVAVLTSMPGDLYLFNKTEVPALDPKNHPDGFRIGVMTRNVLNGNFYTYSGNARDNHDGAADLAADATSQVLLESSGDCPWASSATQSLKLKKLVSASPVPKSCEAAKKVYDESFKTWVERGL